MRTRRGVIDKPSSIYRHTHTICRAESRTNKAVEVEHSPLRCTSGRGSNDSSWGDTCIIPVGTGWINTAVSQSDLLLYLEKEAALEQPQALSTSCANRAAEGRRKFQRRCGVTTSTHSKQCSYERSYWKHAGVKKWSSTGSWGFFKRVEEVNIPLGTKIHTKNNCKRTNLTDQFVYNIIIGYR